MRILFAVVCGTLFSGSLFAGYEALNCSNSRGTIQRIDRVKDPYSKNAKVQTMYRYNKIKLSGDRATVEFYERRVVPGTRIELPDSSGGSESFIATMIVKTKDGSYIDIGSGVSVNNWGALVLCSREWEN